MTYKGIIINLGFIPTKNWKDVEVNVSEYIDEHFKDGHFIPYSKSYSEKLLIFPYIECEYSKINNTMNMYQIKDEDKKLGIFTYKYDDYTGQVIIYKLKSNMKYLLKISDLLDTSQIEANDIQAVISQISWYIEFDLINK